MAYLRDFRYRGETVGKVNTPARQTDGTHIKTIPQTYLEPENLHLMLLCLLDGYDYRIHPGGEINLRLPKNVKYGPILNGIAKAYYTLQTGKRSPPHGQQTLTETK